VGIILSAGASIFVRACELFVLESMNGFTGLACLPEAGQQLSCPGPNNCTLPGALSFSITHANWDADMVGAVLGFEGTGNYAFRLE
jgi:hypothetical protein